MSQINEQFYGPKEDWVPVSQYYPDLKKTAYPYGDSDNYQGSLMGMVESSVCNPEGLASMPLDPTIIPWKIGEGSDVFGSEYIYPYCDNWTSAQTSTWQYDSEPFLTKWNGGYRFFLAQFKNANTSYHGSGQGIWRYRWNPFNLRSEIENRCYRDLIPIVDFDYSKARIMVYVRVIEKSRIDDPDTYWGTQQGTDILLDTWISSTSPDYFNDYYVIGFDYELFYEGTGDNKIAIGMFPFDPAQPTKFANQYYPYGRPALQYTYTPTPVNDIGQVSRISIGGTIGGAGSDWAYRWDSTVHTDQFELYQHNYTETSILKPKGGWPKGEGQTISSKAAASGNEAAIKLFKTYNDLGKQGIIEYAREQAAYLGFWFTGHSGKLSTNPEDFYLPIFDSNGKTTGQYLAYTDPDVENEDNFSWTNDVYERSPYSPSADQGGDDGDPNTYTDVTNYVSISGVYAPTTERYLITDESLKELLIQLQKISIPFAFPEEYDPDDLAEYTADVMRAFGTTNPLELIDTIIAYPVDFGVPLDTAMPQTTTLISGTAGFLVVVGNSHCDVSKGGLYTTGAQHIEHEAPYLFFPTWEYYDKYKCFLDYSPYSSSVLTLPWCGSVNLDPEIYIGNKLNVLYNVDIDTGLCKAVLYNDGKVVDSINGQVGARVTIETADYNNQVNTAIQANQIQQQQRFNQIKSIASIATAGLATIATGGASAAGLTGEAIGTAFNMAQSQMTIDQANYKVEAATVPYKQVVSGTDSMSLMSVNGIHQVIYRPKFLPTYDAVEYGKQVGFATLEFGPLSNYHGYTEVETVNFNGVFATEAEQEMIKSALKSGVYLP